MTPQEFDHFTARYTKAWNSGDPAQVADHYSVDGGIHINRGDAQYGREAMLAMAGGFMAAFPDLALTRDFFRLAGDHGVFGWTLSGHHAETKAYVHASGWEEWEMGPNGLIAQSLGWFDGVEYERQVNGAG